MWRLCLYICFNDIMLTISVAAAYSFPILSVVSIYFILSCIKCYVEKRSHREGTSSASCCWSSSSSYSYPVQETGSPLIDHKSQDSFLSCKKNEGTSSLPYSDSLCSQQPYAKVAVSVMDDGNEECFEKKYERDMIQPSSSMNTSSIIKTSIGINTASPFDVSGALSNDNYVGVHSVGTNTSRSDLSALPSQSGRQCDCHLHYCCELYTGYGLSDSVQNSYVRYVADRSPLHAVHVFPCELMVPLAGLSAIPRGPPYLKNLELLQPRLVVNRGNVPVQHRLPNSAVCCDDSEQPLQRYKFHCPHSRNVDEDIESKHDHSLKVDSHRAEDSVPLQNDMGTVENRDCFHSSIAKVMPHSTLFGKSDAHHNILESICVEVPANHEMISNSLMCQRSFACAVKHARVRHSFSCPLLPQFSTNFDLSCRELPVKQTESAKAQDSDSTKVLSIDGGSPCALTTDLQLPVELPCNDVLLNTNQLLSNDVIATNVSLSESNFQLETSVHMPSENGCTKSATSGNLEERNCVVVGSSALEDRICGATSPVSGTHLEPAIDQENVPLSLNDNHVAFQDLNGQLSHSDVNGIYGQVSHLDDNEMYNSCIHQLRNDELLTSIPVQATGDDFPDAPFPVQEAGASASKQHHLDELNLRPDALAAVSLRSDSSTGSFGLSTTSDDLEQVAIINVLQRLTFVSQYWWGVDGAEIAIDESYDLDVGRQRIIDELQAVGIENFNFHCTRPLLGHYTPC